MKAKSHVFSATSGSVAGTTHLRGRSGLVVRAKGMPRRKRRPVNTDVTNLCNHLRMVWTETLTETQREGWRQYARQVPKINALGEAHYIVGWQWFGFSLALDAPTDYTQGPLGPLTYGYVPASDLFSLSWLPTEQWPNIDGAALLIWASHGHNPSIANYRGSYFRMQVLLGSSTVPPASPTTFAIQDNQPPGTRVHFKARAIYPDGRYSAKRVTYTERGTPLATVISVHGIGSNSYDWTISEPVHLVSPAADPNLRTSGGPAGPRTATAVNVFPPFTVRTNMGPSSNGQTNWSITGTPISFATDSGNPIGVPQSGAIT